MLFYMGNETVWLLGHVARPWIARNRTHPPDAAVPACLCVFLCKPAISVIIAHMRSTRQSLVRFLWPHNVALGVITVPLNVFSEEPTPINTHILPKAQLHLQLCGEGRLWMLVLGWMRWISAWKYWSCVQVKVVLVDWNSNFENLSVYRNQIKMYGN